MTCKVVSLREVLAYNKQRGQAPREFLNFSVVRICQQTGRRSLSTFYDCWLPIALSGGQTIEQVESDLISGAIVASTAYWWRLPRIGETPELRRAEKQLPDPDLRAAFRELLRQL